MLSSVEVIGGGLSGCVFALSAGERGMDCCVFEPNNRGAASRAAAGIINPVTGMRFSRSWRIDEFLPAARTFFTTWGDRFDVPLWHERPVVRLFRSPELREGFFKRRTLEALAPYATRLIPEGEAVGPVENRNGGVWIEGGGWVDIPRFLDEARRYLEAQGKWVGEKHPLPAGGGTDAVVVDCRGYVVDDPWWGFLPWKPAKGEVLTMRSEGVPDDRILNRAQFIQPLEGDDYRFGATYEWDDLSPVCSEAGKAELLAAWDEWVRLPEREVLDHRAGIRPIIRDQKPVLGRHPELERVTIFNGMGSKGASWAPLLAESLQDFILNGTPLSPAVNILRFCE